MLHETACSKSENLKSVGIFSNPDCLLWNVSTLNRVINAFISSTAIQYLLRMVENEEETAFKSEMNKSFRIFENAQDLKKNFDRGAIRHWR